MPSRSSSSMPRLPATLRLRRWMARAGAESTNRGRDGDGSASAAKSVLGSRPTDPLRLHLEGESPLKYFSRGSRLKIRSGDQVYFDAVLSSDFSVTAQLPSGVGSIVLETDQSTSLQSIVRCGGVWPTSGIWACASQGRYSTGVVERVAALPWRSQRALRSSWTGFRARHSSELPNGSSNHRSQRLSALTAAVSSALSGAGGP
jgi:hypothetical protein